MLLFWRRPYKKAMLRMAANRMQPKPTRLSIVLAWRLPTHATPNMIAIPPEIIANLCKATAVSYAAQTPTMAVKKKQNADELANTAVGVSKRGFSFMSSVSSQY
jgi:hypothetical protein